MAWAKLGPRITATISLHRRIAIHSPIMTAETSLLTRSNRLTGCFSSYQRRATGVQSRVKQDCTTLSAETILKAPVYSPSSS